MRQRVHETERDSEPGWLAGWDGGRQGSRRRGREIQKEGERQRERDRKREIERGSQGRTSHSRILLSGMSVPFSACDVTSSMMFDPW